MVSPTNKKWGLCSNRRSTRRWANRRPGESRHHHDSVIVAGARPRHLCACHPFVLHVSVARTAKSGEGAVAVHPDGAAPSTRRHSGIHRMVERAAPRRRAVKPDAANGGGPEGQALQPDGGEQTIELAIR